MAKRTPPHIRFQRYVDRSAGPSGCWPWTGALSDSGYGVFGLAAGRLVYAHRYAFQLKRGPVPPGKHLDHRCHDPAACTKGKSCHHRRCCNPWHLRPATPRENNDRSNSITAAYGRATRCQRGHPFDEANTLWTPMAKGGIQRMCRTCKRAKDREAARRYRERHPERFREAVRRYRKQKRRTAST